MNHRPVAPLERLALVGFPLLVAVALLVAIDHDPARGITFSNSPYTDEAWRALNARNLVLLGSWTTDAFALHLEQLPLSIFQAVVFSIGGVGLVQARLISVAATVAMAAILLIGLRRPLGVPGALAAAVAVTLSTLTLYYGRLALLEPVVSLALCLAAVAAIRATEAVSVRRWAVVCGVAFGVALLLKANALASMVGILGAVGSLAVRIPRLRGFIGIVLGIVAVGVIAWVLVVAIPNIEVLRETIAASPIDSIPISPGGWLADVRRFVTANDGLVALTWPILTAAVVGSIIVVWDGLRGGSRLTGTSSAPTRLALIGGSWVVVGLIGVASFGYQPNRYVVPLLPGLALIVGSAVSVIDRRTLGQPGALRGVAMAAIVGLLAIPGLVADAGWVSSTGRTEVDGQAAVEAIVPAGAHLAGGYAPLFAMRLPVTTTFTIGATPLNQGDLYAAGVRWFVVEAGAPPPITSQHLAAWAARQERWCTTWGRDATRVCLVSLP